MQEHAAALGGARKRKIHVANLDPAAEVFHYSPVFDVRDLVSVPEVMEELGLVRTYVCVCVVLQCRQCLSLALAQPLLIVLAAQPPNAGSERSTRLLHGIPHGKSGLAA
jgi:hypothetical protein